MLPLHRRRRRLLTASVSGSCGRAATTGIGEHGDLVACCFSVLLLPLSRCTVLCRAVHYRVTYVLHCPEISSIAAASLDKTVSMTDLEKCITVRTLKGATSTSHL